MDASFRPLESWLFPDAVLARFAPKSCSGFAWGPDGLMYASGHDRPEVYALRLPKAGATLELVATLPVPTEGQAIDWEDRESVVEGKRVSVRVDLGGRRRIKT